MSSLLRLSQIGYDIETKNHADAVLRADFSVFLSDLTDTLANFEIPDSEIVKRGGNRGPMTKRLAGLFDARGWKKRVVTIEKTVDGQVLSAPTHEIDHVCSRDSGNVAIEIEWNAKDTSFDRDLANFRRLHSDGWLSVGVIVTRGRTLHGESMRNLIRRYADRHPRPEPEEWTAARAGKFSASTTHWEALQTRLARGEGNPCPMLLLGLPAALVTPT